MTSSKLSQTLSQYRQAHNLSLRIMAPLVGISFSTLGRIERGETPSARSETLCQAYFGQPGTTNTEAISILGNRLAAQILSIERQLPQLRKDIAQLKSLIKSS